jgi:hypothetical protein
MTREELRPYLKRGVDHRALTEEQVAMLSEFVETLRAKFEAKMAPLYRLSDV